MSDVCMLSHICFLNCGLGCNREKNATKEEKSQAQKELTQYRKRFGIVSPKFTRK